MNIQSDTTYYQQQVPLVWQTLLHQWGSTKSYADRVIDFEGADLYCTWGCIFKRRKNGVAPLMMTLTTEMPIMLRLDSFVAFIKQRKTWSSLMPCYVHKTPNAVTHCKSPVPPLFVIPPYQNNHPNLSSFPTDLTFHIHLCCARSLAHCRSLSCWKTQFIFSESRSRKEIWTTFAVHLTSLNSTHQVESPSGNRLLPPPSQGLFSCFLADYFLMSHCELLLLKNLPYRTTPVTLRSCRSKPVRIACYCHVKLAIHFN